jgi:hypothetical protein
MGFKDVKRRLILALLEGRYRNVPRATIEVKNVLHTGLLDSDEVALIVMGCRGTEHQVIPHHRFPQVNLHLMITRGWYIKFYFVDADVALISVHRTETS